MGRKVNESIPDHPAITPELFTFTKHGQDSLGVKITCPSCQTTRVRPVAHVRVAIKRGNFTGHCQSCHKPRASSRRPGRWRLPDGNFALSADAMHGDELQRFQQRRNSAGWLHEQVWIMTELIGRNLRSYERVIHINGRRNDNRPENLALTIIYPDGKRKDVLTEIQRAKAFLAQYESLEAALIAAKESVTELQDSQDLTEPQDAPNEPARSAPSTVSSNSLSVSPVE